jgi:hypothetical protein
MARLFLNQLRSHRSASLVGIVLLYACATLQFIRFYIVNASFYLHMPAYLAGHERLPFQERVLPIPLIIGLRKLPMFSDRMTHLQGAFTAKMAPLYVISLIAITVAAVFTQKLYLQVTRSRSLELLVYPVFLFTMMWTYSIHLDANYSYPYDMISVAFFSAGVYFIYTRRFLALTVVVLLGTLNRETTLFLIGIYVIDSMSRDTDAATSFDRSAESIRAGREEPMTEQRRSFSLASVEWSRAIALFLLWGTIELVLARAFEHNSRAEDYLRFRENIGRLKPRLWPALLNICGYLLPAVVIFRSGIYPRRFRNYLWILPFWFAVMFCTGVILETRIYGELCPYVAVAAVLILEQHVTATRYAREAEVVAEAAEPNEVEVGAGV